MPERLRVLLAEDSPEDADLIVRALRQARFDPDWQRVETEHDYVGSLAPDLDVILSDYAMPSFSGLRALQLLREMCLPIPFIIVSGTVGEDIAAETMRHGADDYLLKDRLSRLGAAIRQARDKRRHQQETARMTDALVAAEARYRSLFENSVEGIYQMTPEGRFLAANPALARMAGYATPEELMSVVTDVGAQLYADPERRGELQRLLGTQGFVSAFETRIKRRDGSLIWISTNATAVRGEAGVVRYEGTAEDITARKKAEARLATQYAVSRALAESASLSAAAPRIAEAVGEAVGWEVGALWEVAPNAGFMRCVGVARSTTASLEALEIMTRTLTFPRGIGLPGRVWARSSVQAVEVAHEKDDLRAPLAARAGFRGLFGLPILHEGQVAGAMDFCTRDTRPPDPDVMEMLSAIGQQIGQFIERERTESALRESEERFRQMADNINEVFWLSDPTTQRMLYVSPAFEAVWGRAPQEADGGPVSLADSVHADDRAGFDAALEALARTGRLEHEYRVARSDGTTRWVHTRAFPIRNEQGEVYRIAGTTADVTERRELEERFLQAQKMEALGQLASGVAHDFNNILGAIVGYSDLLLKGLEGADRERRHVEEISKAAGRATALTKRLLAFGRKQVLEPKVLDLNAIVTDMEGMLKRLIGETIHFQYSLAPGLGRVKADPGQIEQVLMNLVVNARDAMPRGGTLTVTTSNATLKAATLPDLTELAPGPYVMLSVRDTGIGMTENVKTHIFEPFFTTKEKGRGTGLGLATCLGIVQQTRGHITVESQPDQGTEFRVHFPLVEGAVQRPAAPAHGDDGEPRGTETVLLVEDDHTLRELAVEVLRDLGYTVLDAADGPGALAIANRYPGCVDLVMTDIVMPEMSGNELAAKFRADFSRTRFLFCSGYTEETIARENILEPGLWFIQKPYTISALARKLREVLDSAGDR